MVDQGASAGNGLRHITKAIHATRRRPTVPGSRSRLSHTIRECADLQQVLRALIAVLGSDLQVIAEEYGYLTLDPATRAGGAKPAWQAPLEGWPQPRACTTSPAAIRAWACQFMIADLARRYSAACPGRPASTSCAYAASSGTANEEPGQCNSARVLHRGSLTLVVSMVPPGP